MNINYASSLYSTSLSFYTPSFGLGRVFPQIKKLRISCGGWLRLTTDDVSSPCSDFDQQSAKDQIYHDLGDCQIRLLVLYPAQSHEPLRGELATRCLAPDTPEYAAISYVWGPSDCTQMIWLHDVQVPIRPSLEQCLRRLRKETRAIVLWIDSLCINQDDDKEKSAQVNIMDRIYASSQKVQVWLGAEEGYSCVGIQVLEYFATHPGPTTEAPWQTLPPDLVALGLSEVMSRAWFTRIWVVQEAGLSRKTQMICGNHSFVWTNDCVRVRQFIRMIKYAAILPEWRNSELAKIDMHPLLELLDLQLGQQLDRPWGSTHRRAPDILDIAYALRHRHSRDPRDMIFALQGLVKDNWSGERLRPDYRLTVDQTYKHLASVIEF